ncbi:Protein BZZ1, partial [Coemansia sp. RSA 2424]
SIGGLNRKAARCALCEYTCHAKCQIKVEPNCQGADADHKSGFLSMFGTLRGKKKPAAAAERHARSASAVSEGSANSTNNTQQQQQQQQQLPPPRLGAASSSSQASLPRQHLQILPPSSSSSSQPQPLAVVDSGTVAVLYDFAGDGATTLTVRASDRVRVVEPDTDASGWTAVALPSGLQGMVPTSYVDMAEYKPPQSPPLPPPAQRMLLEMAAVEHVVALYDFVARDPDELSVTAGERMRVVSRDIGDGWIQCEVPGGAREGRLPVAYVRSEDDE